MAITNAAMKRHDFLREMYGDDYFPDVCVEVVEGVLVQLCEDIERDQPADLEALDRLTHAATESINALAEVFEEHDSELETGAREAIAADFAAIAGAYGFADADVEALIAPRDW